MMSRPGRELSRQGFGIPTGDRLRELATQMGMDLKPSQIAADAIDLRLSERYRRLKARALGRCRRRIDMWSMKCDSIDDLARSWPMRTMPIHGIWLKPGEVLIGVSVEEIAVPTDHVGIVVGRATYSRMGLSVCTDVAKIQAGRRGHIHFQIMNHNSVPIRILPHMYIAQLMFLPITDTYPLSEHQWIGEGVHPPPYQFDHERELSPCVEYVLRKRLEEQGSLDIDTEIATRLPQIGSMVEEATKLGMIVSRRKPLRLSKKTTWILGIFAAAVVSGLVQVIFAAVQTSSSNKLPSFIATGLAALVVIVATFLIVKYGRYGGEANSPHVGEE